MELVAVDQYVNSLPSVPTETDHFFSTGIYTRQTRLKAGTLATGKRHKQRTLNILIEGTMRVMMDDDPSKAYRIEAPATFESEAGVRKVVFCESDCTILNVHRTDETDVAKLEEALIMPDDIEGEITKEDSECHG